MTKWYDIPIIKSNRIDDKSKSKLFIKEHLYPIGQQRQVRRHVAIDERDKCFIIHIYSHANAAFMTLKQCIYYKKHKIFSNINRYHWYKLIGKFLETLLRNQTVLCGQVLFQR